MPSRRPLTFDTFVATGGSCLALDACVGAASQVPAAPRSLVLTGPTGCGKTHLLCAVAATVTATGAGTGVVYTTGNDLRARLVLALRVGAPTDGLVARPGTRLAVIDDLQSLREHPASQALIARSWAAAVRAGVTVVGACSGTAEPAGGPIAPLREALGCETVDWIEMARPTRAEALQILDTLIRGYQAAGDDTTTRRVLDGWNGDVRRLVGAAAHGAFTARHRPASPPPWVRSA